MRPTTVRLLAVIAGVAFVVTFGLMSAWERSRGTLPEVPETAPIVLALLAVALLVAVVALRPRLRPATERASGVTPLHPLAAARVAVLALASSRAGAVALGGYAGFGLAVLLDLDSDFRRRQLLLAGLCVVASTALVVAAVLLERACRLPDDQDRSDDTSERGLGA